MRHPTCLFLPLLLPIVACSVDKPQKVAPKNQGYTAIFPGPTTGARYSEWTPYGQIYWFNTSYTSTGRLDLNFNVEVGNLPEGNQGGATLDEMLQTLKGWLAKTYPGLTINELDAESGPGYEYKHKSSSRVINGKIVLRRGRLHHARGTSKNDNDPEVKKFLRSFVVDP